MSHPEYGFSTQQIHAGHQKNTAGSLAIPIYQSSTFVFDSAEQGGRRFGGQESGYIYSRLGNPTNSSLEEKVAALEGGEACVSTASGIGAIASTMWTILKAGDHVVAGDTLYGCTRAFLGKGLSKFGIQVDFVDCTNLELVKQSIKENTKVVYLETPANPNMKITDIEEVAKLTHTKEGRLLIVDNTFCTPYAQQPLKLGADVVIHSATKYLNGHGDVVAGFVVGKKHFINEVRFEGIKDFTGSVLSPHDAFLIIRGMKTLSLRMEKHSANAMKIAEFLEQHPNVEKILYPGLKSFAQYDVAKKQMKLPGGMMAFEVKGGMEAGIKLMNNLKLMTLAVSLGDAETLIQHPASMTHASYTREQRIEANITDGLVRLSVGLEDVEDLIADLKQALDKLN
jgi:methionine-gamma-lyase